MNLFIFECSTATYLECIQKSVFGSNLPWPTQVKKGDHCCLYHYEVGTLFALWQATTDGGRNLVPKAWGGRFPFHVKVALATPDILEIPKSAIPDSLLNPATAKLDNAPEPGTAQALLALIQSRSAPGN